MDRTCRSGW